MFMLTVYLVMFIYAGISNHHRRYKGQSMVERSICGGHFSQLLAQMHRSAMDASLERSTQATGSSAVKAWARFCEIVGANMLCIEGTNPYSTSDTIYLIMAFSSFEAIRGINPKSTFSVNLPAIKNFYIKNGLTNKLRSSQICQKRIFKNLSQDAS